MHTKTACISDIPPAPESGARLRAEIPDTVKDGLHALMVAASQGDRRAIGAIAFAFLSSLVAMAESALEPGTVAGEKPTASEVVTAFFDAMAAGSLASRPPAPGEGLEWMERMVHAIARGLGP